MFDDLETPWGHIVNEAKGSMFDDICNMLLKEKHQYHGLSF